MSKHNKNSRSFAPFLFAFAAVAGIALGACKKPQVKGNGTEPTFAVNNACNSYCKQAKLCKDEINEEKCRNDCASAMSSCQADEQGLAVKKLEECSNESCGDFLGCTISAGAQCVFGI